MQYKPQCGETARQEATVLKLREDTDMVDGGACRLRTVDQELGGHLSLSAAERVGGRAGVVALQVLGHLQQREAVGRQVPSEDLRDVGLEAPLHLGRRPGGTAAAEVHLGALGCIQGAIGEGTRG